MAAAVGMESLARSRKQDVIFNLLKRHAKSGEDIYGDGVLEILQDGFGFCARRGLRTWRGLMISMSPAKFAALTCARAMRFPAKFAPKEGERYFALLKVNDINTDRPESSRNKILFENLTPLFPQERLVLEVGNGATEDLTGRIIDLIAPIGKGQRGLIVAPPKAGKTIMMQNIAQAITRNNPDVHLIVLLIDERPEEVTEMQRSVRGEVVASTLTSRLRATYKWPIWSLSAPSVWWNTKRRGDSAGFGDPFSARLQHRNSLLRQSIVRWY